jgi:Common central domain of tyrosinase
MSKDDCTQGSQWYIATNKDMTSADWNTFVTTLQRAQNTVDPSSTTGLTYWESASAMHSQLSRQIHWNCVFFAWHRLFLVHIERKLQSLNPNFFFPYWDSGAVSTSADSAPLWKYIGTNGNPARNNPFGSKNIREGNNRGRPLRRDYTSLRGLPSGQLWNALFLQSLRQNGFAQWARQMEINHGTLHNLVGGAGGQMTTYYSPADPVLTSKFRSSSCIMVISISCGSVHRQD